MWQIVLRLIRNGHRRRRRHCASKTGRQRARVRACTTNGEARGSSGWTKIQFAVNRHVFYQRLTIETELYFCLFIPRYQL